MRWLGRSKASGETATAGQGDEAIVFCAAARNQRPFLIQAYQRDMGGGHKLMMKEVDVPITVGNCHWGGLRLAYRL